MASCRVRLSCILASVDCYSVPSGGVQEHDGPVYLLSPHLSVAEIEPTYLIYPPDVGDRARPHIVEQTLGDEPLQAAYLRRVC